MDDRINYIKITHAPTESSTQAYAPSTSTEKSISLRVNVKNSQASLDCDVLQNVIGD